MFGLLSRRSRRPVPSPRRVSLRLEALEARDCPASRISSSLLMSIAPVSGNTVQLTGYLKDANAANVAVNFAGVVTGSAQTDAEGYFSYTGMASSLGSVSGTAKPVGHTTPMFAEVELNSNAPVLTNLAVSYDDGRNVTITGQVLDAAPNGLTVTFSGVASGTIDTDVDGNFSATLLASQLGQITVSVTNQWGLKSDAAAVTVASSGPAFQSFDGVHGTGSVWILQGKVLDASPAGMTVTFTGLPGQTGTVSTTTDADGNFWLSLCLPSFSVATVTATATNCWGLQDSMLDVLMS